MTRRRAVGRAAAIAAAALAVLGLAAPAHALPPGGAGPDTPGTSSTLSPATVRVGGTVSFTVRGYPAGETLSVKVDDGVGYSDQTTQGSGVVYQQKISSSGTVSGSFALPSFVKPGVHWLRFLASEEFTDAKGNVGVNGYTNRSPDFTVVAKSSGGAGSKGGTGAKSSGGSSRPDSSVSPSSAASASPGSRPSSSPSPSRAVGGSSASASPSGEAAASAQPSDAPAPAAASSDGDHGFPWLGLGVFVLAAIVGGIGVWLALRRRPGAPTS